MSVCAFYWKKNKQNDRREKEHMAYEILTIFHWNALHADGDRMFLLKFLVRYQFVNRK